MTMANLFFTGVLTQIGIKKQRRERCFFVGNFMIYKISLAWSAKRERSPRAKVTWPLCAQPLNLSTT